MEKSPKLPQFLDYGLKNFRAKTRGEIHKAVPVFFFGIGSCLEEVVGMKRIGLKGCPNWFDFLLHASGLLAGRSPLP